jgi:hypothetical protein
LASYSKALPRLKSVTPKYGIGGKHLPKKNEVSISSEPVYKKEIPKIAKKQKKTPNPKA